MRGMGGALAEAWKWFGDNSNAMQALGALVSVVVVLVGWFFKSKPQSDQPGPNSGVSGTTIPGSGNNLVNHNAGNVTIQNGLTPEIIKSLGEAVTAPLERLTQEQKEIIHKQEKELGVGREAISSFLAIIREKDVPPEQWPSKLKEIAERHNALLQQLQALPKGSPEMVALKESAKKAIAEYRYDDADAVFDQLLALQGEETASVWASRAELAMTRLRYKDAAQYFVQAADALPPSREEQKNAFREQESGAWYQQGDEFGDNEALKKAIQLYSKLLELQPREGFPLEWAATHNNLGSALTRLGERENGTESLTSAVTAFREALQERTRERVPLDWAMTQNNLGNALQALGKRESDTEKLTAAVTAFREALKEWTRERVPLDWAMTQNNLGVVLQTLGERESGTKSLTAAVTAYLEALQERTRERVSLHWATTQNNLGNALQALGKRESDTEKLTAAVTAYREALQEYTWPIFAS
ncbi:MAG: tetratricopeptide repeat protein [Magnetococcales bacterium]|nr:tetratricopeptide repeat protein [Magnetococcales bacterium]